MSNINRLAAIVVGAKYVSFYGYLLAIWFCGTILNFLFVPGLYDMVLHNIGLVLVMMALARLGTRTHNIDLVAAYAVVKRR